MAKTNYGGMIATIVVVVLLLAIGFKYFGLGAFLKGLIPTASASSSQSPGSTSSDASTTTDSQQGTKTTSDTQQTDVTPSQNNPNSNNTNTSNNTLPTTNEPIQNKTTTVGVTLNPETVVEQPTKPQTYQTLQDMESPTFVINTKAVVPVTGSVDSRGNLTPSPPKTGSQIAALFDPNTGIFQGSETVTTIIDQPGTSKAVIQPLPSSGIVTGSKAASLFDSSVQF